jgi:hypothetical protein
MKDSRKIELSREEAATVRWALTYVAQGLGETHLKKLLEDESLSETGFGERAERILNVAHRLESEFNLTVFE